MQMPGINSYFSSSELRKAKNERRDVVKSIFSANGFALFLHLAITSR